ncbi:MAG TPA: glycosyltransferase [Planctomycetota bacterium]|nr:glycosyltransferase [Planctomycetota bacterium]
MACSNYWTSPIQVGDQHLARLFVEAGWDVGYLSTPISPLHYLRGGGDDLRERAKLWRGGGARFLSSKLWAHVPLAMAVPKAAPGLSSAAVFNNWHKLTCPNLRAQLRRNGFESVDLIYLRDVKFSFLLDTVKAPKSVFRLADNDAGFREYTRAHQAAEARTLQRATHVCYTAKTLENRVTSGVQKRMLLRNGVALENFATQHAEPGAFANIPRPRAIYVGSIEYWFDFELLTQAARALPNVNFILVGHPECAKEKLGALKNVHILGRRPYAEVPAMLQHSDVGLIPFDVAAHPALVNAINPIKLYEYLAAGLPTVATAWDELRYLAPPAELCDNRQRFIEAIRSVLASPPEKEPLMAFARQYDWKAIFQQLLQFLECDR